MPEKKFSAVAELLSLVRPYKWSLIVVVASLVVLAGLNMAMPKLLGYTIDTVFSTTEEAPPVSYGRRQPLPVRHSSEPIAIDGDLADWKMVPPMPLPYEGLKAGAVHLTWREDGLYGMVRPGDSTMTLDRDDPRRGDCLELFIQKDAVRDFRRTGATVHYAIAPDSAAADGACLTKVLYGDGSADGELPPIQARWTMVDSGGWGMEFLIPAARLRPAAMTEGTKLLLNFALRDDGRTVQRFFVDPRDAGQSPEMWAPVVLEMRPQKVPTGTPSDPVEITLAPGDITVDGSGDDWTGVPAMPLPYTGDAESYVRMAWSSRGLYGLVTVPDEKIEANTDLPWEADSFELFIEKDGARAADRTENTTQYTFSPLAGEAGECHVRIPFGRDEEIYSDPGILSRWQPTATGYALEFLLPARLLSPAQMVIGTQITMNFAVNDGGVAVQQLASDKNTALGWRSPCNWASVRLRHELSTGDGTAARFRLMLGVLFALLCIYLLRNVTFFIARRKIINVGEHTAFDLRRSLIAHLHSLSIDFYQKNKPGKLSARVMLDVQAIQSFIQEELANIILNVLMLIVAACIMFSLDWFLALVTLAVMPLHVFVYSIFRRPIATYARQAKEHIADVAGDLIEQFDAMPMVKAGAVQEQEEIRFSRSMRRGMRAQIIQSNYYLLQKVAADLSVGVGIIILFGVGGYSVMYRGMSAGDFVAFYAYIGLLYPLMLKLVAQAGKFTRTATSVERVADIIQIVPDVQERPEAIDHHIAAGRIVFEGVSFGYTNGRVLDDVSFVIEPGEHVLITGISGAGKSTLVNMIPRFADPQEGRISIDGMDVRDFTLKSLRSQIGFVFQDLFLFNDTILANVRYSVPDAADEDVVEACRKAYAHGFIEDLADGYLTVIGEGGVQLSQGEKRRMMIARAILRDPKILIMDEPLVSLDAETKAYATEGLSSLIGNRTVLTITHYPDELPRVDKIIRVADGRVTVEIPQNTSEPS
jgi:ATP-binding cassette, subfamily B, putative efflux pump